MLYILLAGYKPYRDECGKGNNNIMNNVLYNFLFATDKTQSDRNLNLPKCKTYLSRGLAYRLIVQSILDTPNNYYIEILKDIREKQQDFVLISSNMQMVNKHYHNI